MNSMDCTPPDLKEQAESVTANLLPSKSKDKYEGAYDNFKTWQSQHKTTSCSENTLLAYFKNFSEKLAPSSLWSIFSMLKKTLLLKEKQNINSYGTLIAYLKKENVGFEPKQSDVFNKDQVNRFLTEAPDVDYLVMKVALVIGLMGACRSQELTDLEVQDLKEEGNLIVVTLRQTKTNKSRSFVIPEEYVEVIKKYKNLRPSNSNLDRFFLSYKQRKCKNQVIGKHTIAAIPSRIALFLNLKNPKDYTGHCIRRTAATIFSNQGGSMLDLKELGGWQSDKDAQGYVQGSIHNKEKISNVLATALNSNENKNRDALTSVNKEAQLEKNLPESSSLQSFTVATKGEMVFNNCVVHVHNYQNK